MKYTAALLAILSLFSCSGYYHIKQAEKHAEKARIKGVDVAKDTLYISTSDTLVQIDTVDNYIRITTTIRDTIRIVGKTVYIAKSRPEVRQQGKTQRAAIKHTAKVDKVKTRKSAKTETKTINANTKNCPWFKWLLFGIGIGILLRKKYITKIVAIIKAVNRK